MRLFSTEQVSKYHPDKYADQISDAILDACLEQDKNSHVACETMVKSRTVILAGEITTEASVDYEEVVRRVSKKLGYEPLDILKFLTVQSPQIEAGVKRGEDTGAGDQGIMFGYACNESESFLPYGFDLANRIIAAIEADVAKGSILYGDAKCQVTVDLDAPKDPRSIKKVLVSACHMNKIFGRDVELQTIQTYIHDLLQNAQIDLGSAELIVNPAGRWTLGGPTADCGLTGRKIVCDQYGGYCAVGGGAFSGKDPTKVDRSAAYMARKMAADFVKNEGVDSCEVQLAYAIGQKYPMGATAKFVDGGKEYTHEIVAQDDMLTPYGMIKALNLLDINYEHLAEGCHYRLGGFTTRDNQ